MSLFILYNSTAALQAINRILSDAMSLLPIIVRFYWLSNTCSGFHARPAKGTGLITFANTVANFRVFRTWRNATTGYFRFARHTNSNQMVDLGVFASTCSYWMFPWLIDLERGEVKVPVRVEFHVYRHTFVACWYSWWEVRSRTVEHALTLLVLLWSDGQVRAKFDQNSYGCEMPERFFCDIGAQLSLLIEPSDLKIDDSEERILSSQGCTSLVCIDQFSKRFIVGRQACMR